ncbi:hypothetical protein D3C71_1530400 [compost metagenome]
MRVTRLNIDQRAAHHSFYRADGIGRIFRGIGARVISHRMALLLVVNDRGQQMTPFGVRQGFRLAAAYGRYEGIGGA